MMNYNPVYPVFVKYNVSQDVWNLHDIYVWHFLLKSFGTRKTFKYLQYRLEHNQSMYPVVTFLCVIFLITWLLTFWLNFGSFRREFAHQSSVTLLKRFILHLHPGLNSMIERRTRLIRNRRERLAARVITSQPVASPVNAGANRGNVREVAVERSRGANLRRPRLMSNRTLSNNRNNATRENTDNESNNSTTG